MFSKGENGVLTVSIPIPPDAYVPSYSASESGGWVLAIFKNPSQYLGMPCLSEFGRKTSTNSTTLIGKDGVHAIGENLTPKRFAEVISKSLGVPVVAKDLSTQDFESLATSDNVFAKEIYLNMK